MIDTYKKEWHVTDLFRLTKSYEQILDDHVLIEKMKYALHQVNSDHYFCEMIKETYFQCGIILRNDICRSYSDYQRFFIYRRSLFYWEEYGDLDKGTIACMVHLLLTKRKNLPEGVGFLLDYIEYEICNRVGNPFKKLYAAGKYRHNIDFGVRAKPLDFPVWSKLDWLYELGFVDNQDIYRIEDGSSTDDDYCKFLAGSLNNVMNCLDFENEKDQLELLDKIGEKIQDNIGCTYEDCEFYDEKPHKCMCAERHLALEPPYFNPLRKKVIEEMKQTISARFENTKKKHIPSESKYNSPIRLKKGVEIAEIERVIYALCKMNYFEVVGKESNSPDRDVFKAFGELLHVDLSNYQNGMKLRGTSQSKHLEIFTKMENTIKNEWKKRNEK